jgi:hypothetical protein
VFFVVFLLCWWLLKAFLFFAGAVVWGTVLLVLCVIGLVWGWLGDEEEAGEWMSGAIRGWNQVCDGALRMLM